MHPLVKIITSEEFKESAINAAKVHIEEKIESGFTIIRSNIEGLVYSNTIKGDSYKINLHSDIINPKEGYYKREIKFLTGYENYFSKDNDVQIENNWVSRFLNEYKEKSYSNTKRSLKLIRVADFHIHPTPTTTPENEHLFNTIIPSGKDGDLDIFRKKSSINGPGFFSMIAGIYSTDPLDMDILIFQECIKQRNEFLPNHLKTISKIFEEINVITPILNDRDTNKKIAQIIDNSGKYNATVINFSGNKINYDKEIYKFITN
ncbi:MAG: hypothetical protein ACP5NV_06640 [Candidatus Woesearchaeota archaeon]